MNPREIMLVSDLLSGPPDMGERVYARSLARALRARGGSVLSVDGPADDADVSLTARRTLLSPSLFSATRRMRPHVVVFVQRSSLTPFGILRSWALGALSGATVVPLVLQPFVLTRVTRTLFTPFVPRRILVVSAEHAESLRGYFPGVHVDVVSAAVDSKRFRPASAEQRAALRRELGLPGDTPLVLHVGHMKSSRNLGLLGRLASRGDLRVVVVTSSSTASENEIEAQLAAAGVMVVSRFIPRIEDWYRAADLYVFPTRDPAGSIAAPASVLEALACGVPVVSTRFGALPSLLSDSEGVFYFDEDSEFEAAINRGLHAHVSPRPRYSRAWDDVAAQVERLALGATP